MTSFMSRVACTGTRTGRRTYPVGRFALEGPVLPPITETVRVAEAFRDTVMSQFRRWCRRNPDLAEPFRRTDHPDQFASRTLSGKELNGDVRKDPRHAFYLPTAEGDDPRWITHVTVTAAEGLGPAEVAALNAVRTLKLDDESAELQVQLVGLGSERDFRAPLLEESPVWISATPFVATRYPKRNGGTKRDRPEDYATPQRFTRHVLGEELDRLRQRRSNLPDVVSIEPLEGLGPQEGFRPVQFRRFRQKLGDDGGRRPSGAFRVVFASPVTGPLCLGHSCHFGLGLFLPSLPDARRVTR
jgi:CRISPR-associated protein Csb2